MRPRGAPVAGAQVWLGSALVALATLVGVRAVSGLVSPGPWIQVSTVLVLVLAVFTAWLRHAGRSRTAPSAWGLALALVALGALYTGTGTAPTLPLPTPDSFERFARLVRSGVEGVVDGRIPVEPSRGIELLVVTGAVAVFLLADLLALGLGRAGLAGVAVLGLWVPTITFERAPSVPVMLLGGISFLLLLTLTRPPGRAGESGMGRDGWPALGAATAVTVGALVAGPLVSAAPFYGAVELPSAWTGAGVDGPLRLSTELDMRASLAERSDRPVLTYTTDAESVGPLRLYTVVDFDGREWLPSDRGDDLARADGVLWPTETVEPEATEPERLSVRIGDLDQERLPITIEPRSVDVGGSWFYDPERDEVVSRSGSTRDTRYVVTIYPRDLSPETLRTDGPGSTFAGDAEVLAVPPTPFAADIGALAQEVTASAGTPYDQAIALQSYFRNIGDFTYDTEVPAGRTEDAVWDFLTDRTGYCVQYATAMTIMARTLGIPARLAIGFLPGRANTAVRGEYVVTGRQAHAWPELYFAGAGWVRFEPTPAVQTGAPPLYADPFAGAATTPEEEAASAAAAQASTAPAAPSQAAVDPGTAGRVGIGTASVPVALVVAAIALVVALLVLGGWLWWRRHRHRPEPVPEGPEEWWEHLRSRLALHGVTWSDATTPRQAAGVVRPRLGHDQPVASAALTSLVTVLEDSRYAPRPTPWQPDDLQEWAAAVERPFVEAAERRAAEEAARVGLEPAGRGSRGR